VTGRLLFSRRAERELRSIFRNIARYNPQAAEKVVRELAHRIDMLRTFPELGQARPDIRPNSRGLVQRPYLVLYEVRPDSGDVEIMAIVDSRRDLSELV
jgi:toxin ParE1/3/4